VLEAVRAVTRAAGGLSIGLQRKLLMFYAGCINVVIARSEATKQSRLPSGPWIASLRSQ
jgi:hypothetical protein